MRSAFTSLGHLLMLLGICALGGCGNSGLPDSVLRRTGTLVVESCTLDPWQQNTLFSEDTRAVVSEVILLCLYIRDDLASPAAPADRASVTELISQLRQQGYRVQLGVTTGEPTDKTPSKLDALLRDPARRAVLVASIASAAPLSDGIVVSPPQLAVATESAFRSFLTELAAAIPSRRVGLFAPPSITSPSDIPGGDAINLSALRSQLSSAYLMTLDLHCCEGVPGPTTSASWISEVALFAKPLLGSTPLAVSLPLYGTHFGKDTQRPVSYLEAVGIASREHIEILRNEEGNLHFNYLDQTGSVSQIYFDDAESTLRMMWQLDKSLSAEVGILYYGLGAEDPGLWGELKERMK